jgi:hypothetical protein
MAQINDPEKACFLCTIKLKWMKKDKDASNPFT